MEKEIRKIIEIIRKIDSDLLIVLVWIILTFIFIIVHGGIIRTILGIPMVLFIPGYVLIAALFPKKNDLDNLERIILSFGFSIATVPLIGLGLNYTTFGIRSIPILVSLTVFSIGLTCLASYRRWKLGDEKFSVSFRKIWENIDDKIGKEIVNKVDSILMAVLTISIIITIGILMYAIIPRNGDIFTEFYILNSSTGKADNYPTKLKVGEGSSILIGMVNHEYSLVNYTMVVSLDKEILESEKVTLENNQKSEKIITFIPSIVGTDKKLEFSLFKEDVNSPYRYLYLWVNVSDKDINNLSMKD